MEDLGKMRENISENDAFIGKNLERLVRLYPHQRIVVCKKEIFTGEDAV